MLILENGQTYGVYTSAGSITGGLYGNTTSRGNQLSGSIQDASFFPHSSNGGDTFTLTGSFTAKNNLSMQFGAVDGTLSTTYDPSYDQPPPSLSTIAGTYTGNAAIWWGWNAPAQSISLIISPSGTITQQGNTFSCDLSNNSAFQQQYIQLLGQEAQACGGIMNNSGNTGGATSGETRILLGTCDSEYGTYESDLAESYCGQYSTWFAQQQNKSGCTTNISSNGISASCPQQNNNSLAEICSTSGTIQPRVSGKNVFDVTLNFQGSNCPLGNGATVQGEAIYSPSNNGLMIMSVNAAKTNGFIYSATQ